MNGPQWITKYRIVYRCKETGSTRYGKPVFNLPKEAERAARKLNKSRPATLHQAQGVPVKNV